MTNASSMTQRPGYRSVLLAAVGMLSLFVALVWAGTARADFGFDEAGVGLNDPPAIDDQGTPFPGDDFPFVNSDGTFVDPTFTRQAGAHPDLTVYFRGETDSNSFPLEAVRDVVVDLPPGFVGNPTAVPTCKPENLVNPGQGGADCEKATQVGEIEITAWASGGRGELHVGLFNIEHGTDVPARFGFNFAGVIGLITPRVRPADVPGGYTISSG